MQIDQAILDQGRTLKQLVQALRRRLTFDENIQCQIVVVPDTGAALTPFLIVHKLGKVPQGYIANLDKHGTIRDVSRIGWTTTQMQLECSVANASLTLVVF